MCYNGTVEKYFQAVRENVPLFVLTLRGECGIIMADKTYDLTPSHGNVGLPFGLCKKYGIEIQNNWTPKDAWNALYREKGIKPDDVYQEFSERKNISREQKRLFTPNAKRKYLLTADEYRIYREFAEQAYRGFRSIIKLPGGRFYGMISQAKGVIFYGEYPYEIESVLKFKSIDEQIFYMGKLKKNGT